MAFLILKFNQKEIEMTEQIVPQRSAAEIEALVQAFEAGTLPTSAFNHYAHMTVAVWYLTHLPYTEAVAAMKGSIKHYADAHGHGGLYHETITLFWMKVLAHYLASVGEGVELPELVYGALVRLGRKDLMLAHYSRELLFSAEARREWVEPDVRPFEFETA